MVLGRQKRKRFAVSARKRFVVKMQWRFNVVKLYTKIQYSFIEHCKPLKIKAFRLKRIVYNVKMGQDTGRQILMKTH